MFVVMFHFCVKRSESILMNFITEIDGTLKTFIGDIRGDGVEWNRDRKQHQLVVSKDKYLLTYSNALLMKVPATLRNGTS